MKKCLKKFVTLFFCVAILAPFCTVFFAKADDDPFTISIDADMSREECWIVAGNHPVPGLSRERIAVELYASSQKKFHKDHVYMLFLEWGFVTSCRYAATPLGGIVCGACISKINDLLGNGISEDIIKLGGDSDTQVSHYYKLWNAEKGSIICSALGSNDSKVIDISGNSNSNGTKVQLWSNNGTGAQKFYVIQSGDGDWYNIFKAGTFKCLDVAGGKAEKGVKVQLWNYNGSDAQKWMLEKVNSEYVYLRSKVGYNEGIKLYLDVSGGKTADGTQLQIWTGNQTDAQKWKIA